MAYRILLAALLLLLFSTTALAQTGGLPPEQQDGTYVQLGEHGVIDWENGWLTAVGIGAPPQTAVNTAQARAMAVRAARVVARRNLVELLKGVQLDSTTTVANYVVSDDVVVTKVRGELQNSRILDTAYMSDGSVEVTVGARLRGDLADTLLPKSLPFGQRLGGSGSAAAGADDTVYTGVVVDARGLSARPAMTPKLLDENGQVVYGPAMVSREFAIKQGMAGYARDVETAARNERVATNPLIVKAVSASGPAGTDLVLPTAEAERLRAMAANLNFFEQCRVMIVLD